MGATGSAQGGAPERFVVTEAERRVADLLPIDVDQGRLSALVERASPPMRRSAGWSSGRTLRDEQPESCT